MIKKINKTLGGLLFALLLLFAFNFEVKAEEIGTATAPTVTFSSNFKSIGWNTTPFTFTISGSSIPESGLKFYQYKINNSFWNNYEGPVMFNESYSGDIVLEVRAVEVSGLSYSIISESYIATFKYDDQKPVNCSISTDNDKLVVYGDDWHSGVQYYGISKSNTQQPTEWSTSNKFSVNNNDYSSYYGWVKDTAGFTAVSSNSVSVYRSISNCSISVEDQTYTGKALTPDINITYNGSSMIKGQDYSVSYSNNVNVGNGTVTITGLGNYSGSITKTFKIKKAKQIFNNNAKMNLRTAKRSPYMKLKNYFKITFGNGKITYKSSNKKVFTINKNNKLIQKGPGIAYITVTASETDNFEKTVKKYKVIVEPTYIAATKVTSSKKGSIKVQWRAPNEGWATGFQIKVSTNKKFTKSTTKTYTVKDKNKSQYSKTIKNLKKGKRYYIKVRSYKKNKEGIVYSAYDSTQKIKVKK